MNPIVVIGSTNTDMVIKAGHLPVPGETILGGDFFMNPGGKGANQAVAAARLGGSVTFITKVGNDIFGKQSLQNLRNEGIDTSCITTDQKAPSGVALITVDDSGENCIVVAPGANNTLTREDIVNCSSVLEKASIVLMQLEIPIETVEFIASFCAEKGIPVILNPAPARFLSDSLLKSISVITPNETETELLTGIRVRDDQSAQKASQKLHQKGVETVIITMGSMGVFISSKDFTGIVPAPKVTAVDTTAAGDTFSGALAVGMGKGMKISEACDFANKAAAISVTRMGAQSSIPFASEIN